MDAQPGGRPEHGHLPLLEFLLIQNVSTTTRQDGLPTPTRMQFLAWILQVQTTHGSSRCRGKGHVYARDPLIQMRPDHTGNQMCTMDQ